MKTEAGKIRCRKCGRFLTTDNYYLSHNPKYPGGRLDVCKKCITMHLDNWDPKTYIWILKEIDVPYVPSEWYDLLQSYEKNQKAVTSLTILGRYLSKMRLRQYHEYRFADTEAIQDIQDAKTRESMQARGFSAGDIEKIIYKNRGFLSYIQDVETLEDADPLRMENYLIEPPPRQEKPPDVQLKMRLEERAKLPKQEPAPIPIYDEEEMMDEEQKAEMLEAELIQPPPKPEPEPEPEPEVEQEPVVEEVEPVIKEPEPIIEPPRQETVIYQPDPEPEPEVIEDYFGTQEPDEDIDLTDEDRTYLRLKWGKGYRPDEWVRLEQLYQEMKDSYDIQGAAHEDNLKLLCKTSLKANQLIDAQDIEGFQKISKVYDQLLKAGNFAASQNKVENGDFIDSISELVEICEREGFIPRYYISQPNDMVDETIEDMKRYTHSLIVEETNLGNLIESAINQIQYENEEENSFDDQTTTGLSEIEQVEKDLKENSRDFSDYVDEDDEEISDLDLAKLLESGDI